MPLTDFILNTDYTIDKIIGYSTGSQTVAAFNFPTITVPHGFSFAPLFFIKWSTTADFSISYDELGTSFNSTSLNGNADSTNMYLFPFNGTTSSVTYYYRIIYFMPSNVDELAEATQQELEDFIVNTEQNYTKIFEESYVASSSVTIDHNLGYFPQVECWYVRASDGRLVHVVDNAVHTNDNPRAIITENSLTLSNGTTISASAWHYKIYLDEI